MAKKKDIIPQIGDPHPEITEQDREHLVQQLLNPRKIVCLACLGKGYIQRGVMSGGLYHCKRCEGTGWTDASHYLIEPGE